MHKINRPEGVYLSKIPNIEICKCIVSVAGNHKKKQIVDLLCVGWDKLIYIYRLNDRPNGIETLELLDFVDLGFMIYNIQAITEGVLVLLDNRQMFHTFRLEVEPELRLNLINEMELQDEVTYQRFLRGKGNRYLKSFNNTIISCSFNPKDK